MAFSSKLAQLFVEFVVKGVEKVMQDFQDLRQSAQHLGGTFAFELNTAADMLQKSLASKLAPSIEATTKKIIDQVAVIRGWSNEQKQAMQAVLSLDSRLGALNKSWEGGAQAISAWGRTFATTMGAASATMLGFATAGLNASVYGTMLQFRMQQLNLTIAGIFRPEIEALIDGISRLTTWFRSLSDEQQETIARWTLGAAAASGLALILPRVASGIAAAVAGLRALTTALLAGNIASTQMLISLGGLAIIVGTLAVITDNAALKWAAATLAFLTIVAAVPRIVSAFAAIGSAIYAVIAKLIVMQALSGPAGWLALAAGAAIAAGAIAGLKIGIDKLSDTTKDDKSKGKRGPLAPAGGGMENLDALYNRIAQASAQVGKPIGERQLDATVEGNGKLDAIKNILAGQKSAFSTARG